MTTASLERVMDGLGENEKYNAVLQGLSGILMGKRKGSKGSDAAGGTFEEIFQLLDEMHANRIKCTIRSASAVVDAATATTNIGIITQGTVCSTGVPVCIILVERWATDSTTQNPCTPLVALASATRFRSIAVSTILRTSLLSAPSAQAQG